MPPIRVYEVATFYTMFNLSPVGEHFVQICTTTPCWLRGSNEVIRAVKETVGIGPGETTQDGKFTVTEVECLGACVNAPMIQINDDYYEDLDFDSTKTLLEALRRGEKPRSGSWPDGCAVRPNRVQRRCLHSRPGKEKPDASR